MSTMEKPETVQKESKIGGRVASGRGRVEVQELDAIHTKGVNMMLFKKDPFWEAEVYKTHSAWNL